MTTEKYDYMGHDPRDAVGLIDCYHKVHYNKSIYGWRRLTNPPIFHFWILMNSPSRDFPITRRYNSLTSLQEINNRSFTNGFFIFYLFISWPIRHRPCVKEPRQESGSLSKTLNVELWYLLNDDDPQTHVQWRRKWNSVGGNARRDPAVNAGVSSN